MKSVTLVTRPQLVALFEALGHKAAGSYDDAKLISKARRLKRLFEGPSEDLAGDSLELFNEIFAMEDPETCLELAPTAKAKKATKTAAASPEPEVETEGAETPKPPKGGKKAKTVPVAAAVTETKAKAKPAAADKGVKKVGVIATIISCLQAATQKKPVTKAQILAKLVKDFPAREEKAMNITVNAQVPSAIHRSKKGQVGKNDDGGFWWIK